MAEEIKNPVMGFGDKEHLQKHIELHHALDELVADFLTETGKFPSKSTVIELMEWSYLQTKQEK